MLKSGSLKRFFATYIFFFACLTLLFLPFYSRALSIYTENTMDLSRETLKSGMTKLEDELYNIYTTGLALFEDHSYATLGREKTPLVDRKLYLLKKASDSMYNMYLYLEPEISAGLVMNNGLVVTSDGGAYTSFEQFYNLHLSYTDFPGFSDWYAYLTDFSGASRLKDSRPVVSDGKNYRTLTFVQRMPINTSGNQYILYATIDQELVAETLLVPDMRESVRLSLTDAEGEDLFLYESENSLQDSKTITYTSPTYGLTATLEVDNALFRQRLAPLRGLALWFSLAYLAVGLILSVLFSWNSFRPFRSLVRSVADWDEGYRANTGKQESLRTDYDYLHGFLSRMKTAVHGYEATLSQQSELLRYYTLNRILHRQVYSDRGQQTAQEYFPDFPASYRVALLRFFTAEQLGLSEFSARQLGWKAAVQPYLPKNGILHFMNNILVVIWPVGADRDGEKERISQALGQLGSLSSGEEPILSGASVSDERAGMDAIADAYQQALQLLRQAGYEEPFVPLFAAPYAESGHAYRAFGGLELSRFYELLRRGQAEGARRMVAATLETLMLSAIRDEAFVRCVFEMYRYALFYILTEARVEPEERLSRLSYDAQTPIQELFDRLFAGIDLTCALVTEKKRPHTNNAGKELLQFIEGGFGNPDLCIRLVTERFSVSENTLQKHIRGLTGKSFFEYLEWLRMGHAWQLLSSGEFPVRAVVEQCGYTSHNSFYKAFKRSYGVSPSALYSSKQKESSLSQ